MGKRLFDIVVSLTGIVLLLPAGLLIALAIRLESSGSPIFRQRRAGRGGKPFCMLKFRTMRADVEPYGHSPRGPEDPRLTRLGRFLRETSLDELPQLCNVLIGQMSLVGPRPLYERQAALWNGRQRRRLEVRPGMTGYAQVFGRADRTHEEKLELDVHYVEHRSFLMDLKILFKTLTIAFSKRGSTYEKQYSETKDRETD